MNHGDVPVREDARVRALEAELQRVAARCAEAEQQAATLATLYAASYRLQGTRDRQETLEAILEIIVNLVGSEEIAVFEVNPEGTALDLVASTGLDPARYLTVIFGIGPIGTAALRGEIYVAAPGFGDAPGEPTLTACIPLRMDGAVTGAIAIFRLLGQKPGLAPTDRDLFELLAGHAARALHVTRPQRWSLS